LARALLTRLLALPAPGAPILAALLAFSVAYVPDMGRGFIKDDFGWIRESRVDSPRDAVALLTTAHGFYRPLVSASFAASRALFGLEPRGYALTNLLIILGAAITLYALARGLGFEAGAAAFAAAVFLLNPHGVKDTILWISGRTSGLVTLFSLLTGLAFVRGRGGLAGLFFFLALLAKEEAVPLPAVLVLWAALAAEGGWARRLRLAARQSWPLLPPLLVYLTLRSAAGAYVPATAPGYYRYTADPGLVARNAIEYLDRAATFAAVVLLALALAVWRRPRLCPLERRLVAMGAIWLAGGYGLTLWLPVRSSLYAVLPSAGVALAAAALARSLWRQAAEGVRRRLVVLAVAVPLVLVPLYRSRNVRAVRQASLTTAALDDLARAFATHPPRSTFQLRDDPEEQPNLERGFGTHLADAVFLRTGRTRQVRYRPPDTSWTEAEIAPFQASGPRVVLALRDGRLAPSGEDAGGSAAGAAVR